MLNRRLVILFFLFVLAFCALGLRLEHLQLSEADHWREEMRAYVHHHSKIETARGSIVDRNNVVMAFDDACYDLAIDYRAMNLDDRWLSSLAYNRVKNETLTHAQRAERIREVKAQIAAQVEAYPETIAKICDTSSLADPSPDAPPVEKIRARFEEIRQLIGILRQDHWSRTYNAGEDTAMAADGDSPDDAIYNEPLKEEHVDHTIIPHIADDVAFYFRQHADEFPGIAVVDSRVRRYPFGTVACHLLGTMRGVDAVTLGMARGPDGTLQKKNRFELPNLLADDDPGNLAGYLPGDRMGEQGLEKLLEPKLRGVRGVRLVELGAPAAATTPAGGAKKEEAPAEKRIDPVAGQSVKLTLDVSLQKDIEDALHAPGHTLLKGKDGQDHVVALVVLSLDGQVLAMVSSVGFDPNKIDDTRGELNSPTNYDRPQANRALEKFRPGSIVKPLIAAAALTEGVITPETTFVCEGHLFPGRPTIFKCDAVHGPMQLVRAITESCNVYFYNVGDRLGVEKLAKWFHYYGLGRETGFELPDTTGFVIDPSKVIGDPERARMEARFLGIGEAQIDASPLQMADAYATLLRGGKFISPRILADTKSEVEQRFTLPPGVLATVKEGMRDVVTSGTGRSKFAGFRLPVGGKTGTADVDNKPIFDESGNPVYDLDHPLKNRDMTPKLGPDKKPLYARAYEKGTHAWFVGYAPADHPKFVVAAVMEFGGHGGSFAAPIVREAFLQLERHNYLPQVDVP